MNILREKVKGCEYPSDQSRVIEQAKFTYSLSRKVFQRQIKIIKDQGKQLVEALKFLKPTEKNKN